MEMALLRICTPALRNDIASLEMRIAALEAGTVKAPAKPKETPPAEEPEAAKAPDITESVKTEEKTPADKAPAKETAEKPAAAQQTGEVLNWQDIIEVLKTTCPLIAGVLKDSKAYIGGGRLLIDTGNTQFKTLVNGSNTTYREAIKSAAEEVLGKRYNLGPYVKESAAAASGDPLAAFADKLKILEND